MFRPIPGGVRRAAAAMVLATVALCPAPRADAQISRPSEDELNAVPPQFLDLVHGRSDKVNEAAGRAARGYGPPPGGGPSARAVVPNPSRDPRDFRGNWQAGGGPPGGQPPLAPGGGAGSSPTDPRPGVVVDTIVDANRMCLVSLGVNLAPMKVYQTAQQLTFIYGNELRARRIYFADRHASSPKPTYNGDSIAHWEGNTLVVDTVAIKGAITLLGFDVEVGSRRMLLATPTLHVVERITRSEDGQQLIDDATWSDDAAKTPPTTRRTVLTYAADAPAYDFECEDVGDKFGPAYGGGVK